MAVQASNCEFTALCGRVGKSNGNNGDHPTPDSIESGVVRHMLSRDHSLHLPAADFDHALFPEHAQIAIAEYVTGCRGRRSHEPSAISVSIWPGPQPAWPMKK